MVFLGEQRGERIQKELGGLQLFLGLGKLFLLLIKTSQTLQMPVDHLCQKPGDVGIIQIIFPADSWGEMRQQGLDFLQ